MRRLTLTTGLAATALLVLTGCFGGTAGSGTPSGSDGAGSEGSGGAESGGSSGVTDCLQGSWDLDEQDVARQLGESLGSNVVSSEASGGVQLTVDGHNMTYVSDVTYTMTMDMGDGLTMIVNQLQAGESSGTWANDGDELVFEDWVSGITITNDITINGETSSSSIPLPGAGDGVPMEVACEGDVLTTHPDASPYTSTWARE